MCGAGSVEDTIEFVGKLTGTTGASALAVD